jgi:hypothetical protein
MSPSASNFRKYTGREPTLVSVAVQPEEHRRVSSSGTELTMAVAPFDALTASGIEEMLASEAVLGCAASVNGSRSVRVDLLGGSSLLSRSCSSGCGLQVRPTAQQSNNVAALPLVCVIMGAVAGFTLET